MVFCKELRERDIYIEQPLTIWMLGKITSQMLQIEKKKIKNQPMLDLRFKQKIFLS